MIPPARNSIDRLREFTAPSPETIRSFYPQEREPAIHAFEIHQERASAETDAVQSRQLRETV